MFSQIINKLINNKILIVIGFTTIIALFTMAGCQESKKTPDPPSNAELSYRCSVSQGFNFKKDEQTMVGHIEYLKIGDNELAADFSVVDPTSANMSNQLKVVGVISSINWNGGYADPIQFSCQVSTSNKNTLATLAHQSLSNTNVEFIYSIYDYDPQEKTYYKCFHSNSVKLKGLVQKSGGELVMSIYMDQSQEVVSPKNYSFSLSVMPQETSMELQLAVSKTNKFVKKWGIQAAK